MDGWIHLKKETIMFFNSVSVKFAVNGKLNWKIVENYEPHTVLKVDNTSC